MSGNPFKKNKPKEAKKPIIAVSNKLLESVIKNNNEIALKLLLYIGQGIQKKEAELKAQNLPIPAPAKITTLSLKLDDIERVCSINPERLRKSIKILQKTILSFENKEEKWVTDVQIIGKARYFWGNRTFEVDMYPEILELVCNLERNLTIIDSTNAMRLSSAYALRFIPIIEHISGYDDNYAKRKEYDLEQLNAIFGTNYKGIKDVVKNVIKGLKEELDKVSKLSFEYQVISEPNPKGKGRPVAVGVMFDVIKNQPSLF